ncbi:SprT-like domain-containing protein [Salinispirillum marinum]|uniref:SprT-like domain-containing protein n=2 Tax=Saccharospirillaceae TaxID=255527 RepID=A0ABV8BGQ0_9GAMM
MTPAERQKLETIETLASSLLARHLPQWSFSFNRQRRTLGLCRYREKRIELSLQHALAGNLDQAKETILHEIAHGLAGPRTGHGPRWQQVMRDLGQNPRVTAKTEYDLDDYTWAIVRKEGNDLHWITGRYRRPQRTSHWMLRGQPHTLGTVYYCRFSDYAAFSQGMIPFAEVALYQ